MTHLRTNTPKILIVDDAKANVLILVETLRALPFELFVAFSGIQALRMCENEAFDLILLDIKMPQMDGFTLCKTLRAQETYADVPILFTSSLHAGEDKIRAFEVGGNDYLVKPLFEQEVRARVMAHLGHRMLLKNLKRLLRQSYHELYNPLAVINSSIELYARQHGKNHYIDAIASASKTLEVIYQDFTHSFVAKPEPKEHIVLGAFVQERADYFALNAKLKKVRFSLEFVEACVHIQPSSLQRIVDNTLSNAIKYAYEETTITLSVTCSGERVRFCCRNHGVPIESPQHIFHAGYREYTHIIGMGIGLELVAHLCHENGILYEVASDVDATLFCYLFSEA